MGFLIVVGIIVILAGSGFYRVDEGQEALVLTFEKMTDHKIQSGLYWHVPLVQRVLKESTTNLHTMEYGYRTLQSGSTTESAVYSDVEDEAIMITQDSNILKVEAMYQYVVTDVERFAFKVDDPFGTMQLAFETVMRRNIQNKSLDDALIKKQAIGTEVLPDFQKLAEDYELGIDIKKVEIQNIYVPQEVISAYEDVNNAKNEYTQRLEEAAKYKNEVLPQARADAYQTVQSAEAYKAEVIAQARGDVANFQKVYEKYQSAKEITRQRLFIETIEQIMQNADVKYVTEGSSDGVVKFLPIENTGGAQ
jgi:membrane protease subunit HflK